MTRYRKKPVVIEAVRVPPPVNHENIMDHGELSVWLSMNANDRDWRVASSKGDILISTLEGEMLANNGDWIIRGIQGEIYPCKPDIFEATYELVEAKEAGNA